MKERQSIFFFLLRIFRSNKKIIQDVELTLSSLFQTQNSQSSYVEMSPAREKRHMWLHVLDHLIYKTA